MSFNNQDLFVQPVKPLDDILEVEGSSLTIFFIPGICGYDFRVFKRGYIPSLLLVVPDVHREKSRHLFSLELTFLMCCINYTGHVEMEPIIINKVGTVCCSKHLYYAAGQSKEGCVRIVRMLSRTITLIHAGECDPWGLCQSVFSCCLSKFLMWSPTHHSKIVHLLVSV